MKTETLVRGTFESPEAFEKFVTAGHAIFTATSHKTGHHLTFRVSRKKDAPFLWVFVLAGPDNTSDYRYLGTIFDDTRQFKATKKSGLDTSPRQKQAFASFLWVWNKIALAHNDEAFTQVLLQHEGRCGCCGRRLTEPESISIGIGPICRGR